MQQRTLRRLITFPRVIDEMRAVKRVTSRAAGAADAQVSPRLGRRHLCTCSRNMSPLQHCASSHRKLHEFAAVNVGQDAQLGHF